MPKKSYMCQFPGCRNLVKQLSELDSHHIKPRSMGGLDIAWNLVTLCPGCHRNVHVPGMKHGIHTLKHEKSIVIFGYMSTSSGRGLHYRPLHSDQECIWFPGVGENMVLGSPLSK